MIVDMRAERQDRPDIADVESHDGRYDPVFAEPWRRRPPARGWTTAPAPPEEPAPRWPVILAIGASVLWFGGMLAWGLLGANAPSAEGLASFATLALAARC
jgi:hypothetical protein